VEDTTYPEPWENEKLFQAPEIPDSMFNQPAKHKVEDEELFRFPSSEPEGEDNASASLSSPAAEG
jgi:hypothetical protein